MPRHIFFVATLLAAAPAISQTQLSIPLFAGDAAEITTHRYSCGGKDPFVVQYVNTPSNTLALIDVAGETRVFVNVISGSGARYVSGAHEFWSKGDTATFDDQMTDAPAEDCVRVAKPE